MPDNGRDSRTLPCLRLKPTPISAIAYTLIETAKLSGVDPQAWLTNTLGRIADHKITKLDELMPGLLGNTGLPGHAAATSAYMRRLLSRWF